MIYIVLGPGRTGSNLICKLLSGNNHIPGGILNAPRSLDEFDDLHTLLQKNQNVLIHTHNPNIVQDFKLRPEECVIVCCKRKNVFDTVMSHIVTLRTGQWENYTELKVDPKSYPIKEFIEIWAEYANDKWFKSRFNYNLPYKKIVDIYYEDIVETAKNTSWRKANVYLQKLFGVVDGHMRFIEPDDPCPHHYKDWISNWQELYSIHLILERITHPVWCVN